MLDVEQQTLDWLRARKYGLGGSDAPKLVGLSPFGGPFDVYMDKTDPERFQSDNPERLRGKLLESAVARWYELETGTTAAVLPGIVIHPQYEWMRASLDRVLPDRGLECKTTTRRLGKQAPDDWVCQVQHYMAVTGLPLFDIAALSGGLEFQLFTIERDEGYIADLIDIERDFWENHILPGVPPEIDGSAGATAYLGDRHPVDNGEEMRAGPDEQALVQMLINTKARLADARREEAKLKNLIKDRMGEYSLLTGPGFRVSWKRTSDAHIVHYKELVATLEGFFEVVAPVLEAAEWDGKDETLLSVGLARAMHTEVRPGGRRFLVRGEAGEVIEEGEDE